MLRTARLRSLITAVIKTVVEIHFNMWRFNAFGDKQMVTHYLFWSYFETFIYIIKNIIRWVCIEIILCIVCSRAVYFIVWSISLYFCSCVRLRKKEKKWPKQTLGTFWYTPCVVNWRRGQMQKCNYCMFSSLKWQVHKLCTCFLIST